MQAAHLRKEWCKGDTKCHVMKVSCLCGGVPCINMRVMNEKAKILSLGPKMDHISLGLIIIFSGEINGKEICLNLRQDELFSGKIVKHSWKKFISFCQLLLSATSLEELFVLNASFSSTPAMESNENNITQ